MKTARLTIALALGAAVLGYWLAGQRSAPPAGSAPGTNAAPTMKPAPRAAFQPSTSTKPMPKAAPMPSSADLANVRDLHVSRRPTRPALPPNKARKPAIIGPSPRRSESSREEQSATAQVEELVLVLQRYGKRFEGNPTGTNAEITATLIGDNPAKARLLPAPANLNSAGELLDHWGTPYFFHQHSGTKTEVVSAGPDGRLHTGDDIVR